MSETKPGLCLTLPDMIRRLLFCWLLAANAEYLRLPAALRDLSLPDGLDQMSPVRMLALAGACAAALTAASAFLPMEQAERTGLCLAFACLAGSALIHNFSVPMLAFCLLMEACLAVYAFRGWNARPVETPAGQPGRKGLLWLTAGLALAFFVFLSVWTVCRVLTFSASTYDFGIFSQMFHYMKTTGLPFTTLERDGLLSHFHVHVSPIYYLLLPFYLLVPRAETLQVLQAAVMASAVIPLWKLGRHHGLSDTQRMLLCAVLLLYPAFAGGANYDLHENCFLTPLLLWLLYGLDADRPWLTAAAALLTLCVKEDAAVYVAVIGLFVLLRAALRGFRENRRAIGLGGLLLGVSLIWFYGATGYLSAVGDGVMTYRYDNFLFGGSSNLTTVMLSVFLCPMKVLWECVDADKLQFIGMTVWPLLALPLFTRRYERWVLLIPYLLINLMSDYPYQHDLLFQYSFGPLACLFYLTLVNLSELRVSCERTVLLCASAAVCALCFTQTVWPEAVYCPNWYREQPEHYRAVRDTLALVPEDASVACTAFYTPYFSRRQVLYDIPHTTREHILEAQYVAFNNNEPEFRKFASDGQNNGRQNFIAFLAENGYQPFASYGSTLDIYYRP